MPACRVQSESRRRCACPQLDCGARPIGCSRGRSPCSRRPTTAAARASQNPANSPTRPAYFSRCVTHTISLSLYFVELVPYKGRGTRRDPEPELADVVTEEFLSSFSPPPRQKIYPIQAEPSRHPQLPVTWADQFFRSGPTNLVLGFLALTGR